MDYPGKDGVSKRQHRIQAAKQLKKEVVFDDYVALSTTNIPGFYFISYNSNILKYYYTTFLELFENRNISYRTIYYYEQVTGNKIASWERDMYMYLAKKISHVLETLDRK